MILHITTNDEWKMAALNDTYQADSLETEGFIHCSTSEQVIGVANERFRGRSDLILLCIDPARLNVPVIYEDCYETGKKFPHIYGPLTPDAVVRVVDFPPNEDGTFTLPEEVIQLEADDTVWLCETEEDINAMMQAEKELKQPEDN